MTTTAPTHFFPHLGKLYPAMGEITLTILRIVAGGALFIHGMSKIQDPLGPSGMVEMIGIFPGPSAFWGVALSCTEFFGGALLVLGLLTRPVAVAATVVLATTILFHWVTAGQGYDGAEKSIIWTAALVMLIANGAGRYSIDRLIGREV